MKKEKFILKNKNSEITIKKWKRICLVPIPMVKTLGFLYHIIGKGRRVIILFKKNQDKISLSLMLSSSDSDFKLIHETYNEFLNFLKTLNVNEVETILVNRRLSNKIMMRFGWKYYSDNWYVGKNTN
ncbi:MAG TPA: hypothetical protein PLW77_10420 [Bacteroidales bacterium]|nr:hypothetical protein [Bacteroidales bacterium]HQB21116.1 hypothetical protein [Bacteroidales bacterium]